MFGLRVSNQAFDWLVWPSSHKHTSPTFSLWGHPIRWTQILKPLTHFWHLQLCEVRWGTWTQWKGVSFPCTIHPSIHPMMMMHLWVLVHSSHVKHVFFQQWKRGIRSYDKLSESIMCITISNIPMIDRYFHQNLVQSGKKGFQPLTCGFGDHCSTIRIILLRKKWFLVYGICTYLCLFSNKFVIFLDFNWCFFFICFFF